MWPSCDLRAGLPAAESPHRRYVVPHNRHRIGHLGLNITSLKSGCVSANAAQSEAEYVATSGIFEAFECSPNNTSTTFELRSFR